jgi:hypothetical protein
MLIASTLFCSMFGITAQGQTGTIKGTLTVKQTSEKLGFAFIAILKKDSVVRNTMTDATGTFQINLAPGTYNVKAEYIGYKSTRLNSVVVSNGKITTVSLSVEPESKSLSEVTVKDSKNGNGAPKQDASGKQQMKQEQTLVLGDMNVEYDAAPDMPPSPPPTDLYITTTKTNPSGNGSSNGTSGNMGNVTYYGYDHTTNAPPVNNVQVKDQQVVVQKQLDVMQKQLYNKTPNPVNIQKKPVDLSSFDSDESEKTELTQVGKLTAGEINDFSKWKMWQDIEANQLSSNQSIWKFYPSGGRYTVQVTNESGNPVVDCPVSLADKDGKIVWNARTDNTGKAELWSNMYDGKADDKNEMNVIVNYNGKEFKKKNAKSFYNGINTIKVPADCSVSNKVDIAFVTDATSSMQDEINYLKTDMEDVIGKVKTRFPELEIRTAGMFYKCPNNSYVTKRSDFSKDVTVTSNFIKENNASEGGDEAVETALDEAVNMLSWSKEARARIIFLVLDEPPAKSAEIIAKLQGAIKAAAEKGIRVIPVVCSGEGWDSSKNLEYLTRCFALATNGTYVFLTDHSGIGNSHTAPETDKYKVETLNDIMVRLLYQYTKVPACKQDVITTPTDTAFTITNDTLSIHTKLPADTSAKTIPAITKTAPGLKYYPNPTVGPLYIEPEGDVKEVFLADINGKLLKRWEVTEKSNKIEVDLTEFSSGIYYIQIPNKDKWVTGKVVLLR